ncbi:hypothetical protein I316_03660 [Kwoniella heveanensis BCC8398]|uniref:[histone H3]-trimethyl-L-lysine(9) demethylase n=1 Tax=Kwoniella heveanensis BCC8398 TaxID=1296120 RepID=A0A1B9GUB4_9TREE|nr:hypothetical protein I316_03660 [Kwoniella heveanensis BCC8398]
MSAEIADQIIVNLPPQLPVARSPSPRKSGPSKPSTRPRLPEQPVAGPSTHRRTRTVDVAMNGLEPSSGGTNNTAVPTEQTTPAVPDKPRYIQPDHFFPLTNHMNTPAAFRGIPQIGEGWLSPEEDPQALRGIPVFKPTMEEFEDFEGYAKATTEWGQYSGIAKIIPPDEWTASVPPVTKSSLSSVRIRNPIQQNILGHSGLFRLANVVKNKSRPLSIEEWFRKCKDKKFAGLGPKDVGRTLNRDSKEAVERRERMKAEIKRRRDDKKKKAEERRASKAAQAVEAEEGHLNADAEVEEQKAEQHLVDGVPPLDPSGNSSHSSPEPHPTTPDSDPIDPWYVSFKPTEDWLPRDTRPEDYTVEACAALERHFWKNMGIGEPSWYGADMEGSLFVDDKTPWNVAHLPNLLNRWDLTNLPGVNSPYLYFGMWGASFAWHVEDMDLFSINYIHFGAPKYWYAIPQKQAEKFERILQGYFTEDARHCDQFLRHKSFAVSPQRLANDGINVNMLVHKQGEFVITYPRGYHAGFNMGFNCAESVNFALDSWVELGRRAKACTCVTHSVRIDVDEMLAKEQRRLKGEQDLLDAIEHERQTKKPRKRQATETAETPSKKRTKIEPQIAQDVDDTESCVAAEGGNMPAPVKIPVMRKKKPKEVIDLFPTRPKPKPTIVKESPVYPCLFCPGLDTSDLMPVLDAPDKVKNIWKPRTEEIKAHHSCALAVPGVGIEDREVDGVMKGCVVGTENVEQARWNLKCAACADKKLQKTGAKIQCTKGKCPKAYHVSCAKTHPAVSLNIWEVETPILPAEGQEPLPEGADIPVERDIKVELLCPQHNPDNKGQNEQKKATALQTKIAALPAGSSIRIKLKQGASIEVTVLEVRSESQDVVVEDTAGERAIHPWSSIDFRPAPVKMLENEYARVHTHIRRSSDHRSVVLTPPTTSSAQMNVLPSTRPASFKPLLGGPPAAEATQLIRPQKSSEQRIQPMRSADGAPKKRVHPPPVVRPAPLRVEQMLNPPAEAIPSRVVLCDAPKGHMLSIDARQSHIHSSSVQPPYVPGYRVPMPPPHHLPHPQYGAPLIYPPHLQHASPVRPYDSRDPYNRPLPIHAAQHPVQPSPAHGYPGCLGLSDQPPPLQVTNGYQGTPMSGYMPLPLYGSSVRTHAAAHSSHHEAQPLPMNGHASFPNGSSTLPPRRSSNGQAPNGVGKIDLGLQRMQTLMSHLRPLSVPAIHLAGTNGKGSVSAILESCLMTAGLSVGRYNSPHLMEARDAVRINGRPPSPQAFADATQIVESLNAQAAISATTFEIATAAAYHLINNVQPPLDIMIIECGMGGAKDATNIIPDQLKIASALTAVGLDHVSFLGDTITKIAEEKAKIAVPGGLLVVGQQPNPDAIHAARKIAAEKGARVFEALRSLTVSRPASPVSIKPFRRPSPTPVQTPLPAIYDSSRNLVGREYMIDTQLSLGGQHQLDNLSLSLTILHAIRSDPRARSIQPKLELLNTRAIQTGVARAEWAGRCSWHEWLDPQSRAIVPVLVDGAHNADSAWMLRSYIDSLSFTSRPKLRFVIGLSDSPGKSIESVLEPLLRPGDEVVLVEFSTPVEGMPWIKPVPVANMHRVTSRLVGQDAVRETRKIGPQGVEEALRWTAQDLAEGDYLPVVCGSLYLVADLYRLLTHPGTV